jgi:glycosyltransferase involved in cell wall biosynthesis
VLASTETVRRSLQAHGIAQTRHWGRGVDLDRFRPDIAASPLFAGMAHPIQLYVGRIAVEKNIGAFLQTRQSGTRVVVGDGPARAELAGRYPDAVFLGALTGDGLAAAYAGADVFVFPSRTDTFGLVMIEALACGTPVAAYPVAGPIDVLDADVACLDEDLGRAIAGALLRSRRACADYGRRFSWEASAFQFREALVTFDRMRRAA